LKVFGIIYYGIIWCSLSVLSRSTTLQHFELPARKKTKLFIFIFVAAWYNLLSYGMQAHN